MNPKQQPHSATATPSSPSLRRLGRVFWAATALLLPSAQLEAYAADSPAGNRARATVLNDLSPRQLERHMGEVVQINGARLERSRAQVVYKGYADSKSKATYVCFEISLASGTTNTAQAYVVILKDAPGWPTGVNTNSSHLVDVTGVVTNIGPFPGPQIAIKKAE